MSDFLYFLVYKPYGVLSQFTKELPEHQTLADLYAFPGDVYPVGRLDADSEGLLLITNDKALNNKLLNPKFQHWRSYWVQVEGIPEDKDLMPLRAGVTITVRGEKHVCLPAKVKAIPEPQTLPERNPPIRERKQIPVSWVEISLQEGKNRQVRKMMAAVGFPVLRLIRASIEGLSLSSQIPGSVEKRSGKDIYRLLGID